jgi:hypothetical protein
MDHVIKDYKPIHAVIHYDDAACCPGHERYTPNCDNCDIALKTLNRIYNRAHTSGYNVGILAKQKEIKGLLEDLQCSSERRMYWRYRALRAEHKNREVHDRPV